MTFPLDWSAGWVVGLMHHLWQSTVVCGSLWLLSVMLRRNAARMRFRLWMLASIKFLLPFSLLITAGEAISVKKQAAPSVAPLFSMMIEGPASHSTLVKPLHAAAPVVNEGSHADVAPTKRQSIMQYALLFVWTAGSLVVAFVWLRSWVRLRAMVRRGTPVGDIAGLHAVIVVSAAEPGVFGIVRPVLMLPEGVTRNLSVAQMEAIVAHELCHVRRRDNLWAALHMMVSAIFWFHPLVWWIGRQMIAEREVACDDAVLEQSHSATEYAEGILNICKFYLEVPVACFSGVTGADLKKRIAHILSGSAAERLSMGRKLVLGAAGVLSIGLPLTFGLLHASRSYAQAPAKTNPEDTWQGTLQTAQKGLRTVLKITKTPDGKLSALFYSIDQGAQPIPVKETTFQNGELALNVEAIDGVYKGKMYAGRGAHPATEGTAGAFGRAAGRT
ncbi:M56 family metallopeptidase [Edaphobacter aggregans]|uniref:M56 family metallopeptidase n=1 Tax=Edaphobacter aggregans TaxID=570835 RepID=UPI000554F0D9|nr:M56 family metallopeptidase [Edaphobacter aggregans]